MTCRVDSVNVGLHRPVVAIVEHVQDAVLFDGFNDGRVHATMLSRLPRGAIKSSRPLARERELRQAMNQCVGLNVPITTPPFSNVTGHYQAGRRGAAWGSAL